MARVSGCRRRNSIITPTRMSPDGDPQSIGCGRSEVVFPQTTAIRCPRGAQVRRTARQSQQDLSVAMRAGLTFQPSNPRNHVLRLARERCADGEAS